MSAEPFEYEERYKVTDLEATHRLLAAAGFVLEKTESQIDHWFIPESIMSADEQYHWFDYEAGCAVRVREQTTQEGAQEIITAKQLVTPGDHSTMTNHEDTLTVAGVRRVLSSVGDEFRDMLADLSLRDDDEMLGFPKVKHLIEQSGRKEYITLKKERASFFNPMLADVVVDLDVIPALKQTALGYCAALEVEYIGNLSVEDARKLVRSVSQDIGYNEQDILAKALPGLAIKFLAKF